MPMLQVRGHFISFRIEGEGKRARLIGVFSDGHRLMEVIWFHKIKQIKDFYAIGKQYVLFGKPTIFNNVPNIIHPEIEEYNPDKPMVGYRGVYPMTETLRKRGIGGYRRLR